MERRLAAILAADVVGYSRLIRADEAGTLAQGVNGDVAAVQTAVDGGGTVLLRATDGCKRNGFSWR